MGYPTVVVGCREMRCFTSLLLTSLGLSLAHLALAQTAPLDYPQWRGHTRDGSASAFAAPKAWPDRLTLKWKIDVGEGYSTPLVIGPRIYTLSRQAGNEVMAARHAATGAALWQTSYPAPHKMAGGTGAHGQGPKSTPVFFDGRLYSLGITGIVSCFDAEDGKLVWQKPAPPVETLYNNSSMSPLVDDGAVIFHVGGHNQGALMKFDAKTGAVRWMWDGDGPAYASPVILQLGGVRQVVAMTQRNIVGVAADSGQLLWKRAYENRFANHSISPVPYRDMIIVSGYEMGVTAFRPVRQGGAWTTETVWDTKDVSMFMSNPVLVGDTLYGLSMRNSGQFFALDARDGRVLWRGPGRAATNTAIVKAADLVFLLNDDGELIVAKSHPTGLATLRTYTVADSSTWAQPVFTGRGIVVKDLTTLAFWTLD